MNSRWPIKILTLAILILVFSAQQVRSQVEFVNGPEQAITVCDNGEISIGEYLSVRGADTIEQHFTWSIIGAASHGNVTGLPADIITFGTTYPPGSVIYTPISYTGATSDLIRVSVTNGVLSDTITFYVTIIPISTTSLSAIASSVCGTAPDSIIVSGPPGVSCFWSVATTGLLGDYSEVYGESNIGTSGFVKVPVPADTVLEPMLPPSNTSYRTYFLQSVSSAGCTFYSTSSVTVSRTYAYGQWQIMGDGVREDSTGHYSTCYGESDHLFIQGPLFAAGVMEIWESSTGLSHSETFAISASGSVDIPQLPITGTRTYTISSLSHLGCDEPRFFSPVLTLSVIPPRTVTSLNVSADGIPHYLPVSSHVNICQGYDLNVNVTFSPASEYSFTNLYYQVNSDPVLSTIVEDTAHAFIGSLYGTEVVRLINLLDSRGCVTPLSDSVVISAVARPTATITAPYAVCGADSVAVTISGSPGQFVQLFENGVANMYYVNSTGILHHNSPGNVNGDTISLTYGYAADDVSCAETYSNTAIVVADTLQHGLAAFFADSLLCLGSGSYFSTITDSGTWLSTHGHVSISVYGIDGTMTSISAGMDTIMHIAANTCGADTARSSIYVTGPVDAGLVTGDTAGCTGSSITLTAAVAGGAWFSSDPFIVDVSVSGVASLIGNGDASIYYVTDVCGADTTVHVVHSSYPTGNIGPSNILCVGSSMDMFDVDFPGGIWSLAATTLATLTTDSTITALASGYVVIYHTINTYCGPGVDSATIHLSVPTIAPPITGDTIVCRNDTITLHNIFPFGNWSSSIDSVFHLSNFGPWWLAGDSIAAIAVHAGISNISYSYTDSGGCFVSTSINLHSFEAFPGVVVSPSDHQTLCAGPVTIEITGATSGTNYQWYSYGLPVIAATDSFYTANTAGTYYSVIENAGCVDTFFTVVSDPPVPVITNSGTGTLYTGAFASYQWFLDGVAIPGATAYSYNITGPGSYSVLVTDINGCAVYSSPLVLGISNTYLTDDVYVYPNPAINTLYLSRQVNLVKVLSVDGKELQSVRDTSKIDISQLPQTIYVVLLCDENGGVQKVVRIVKSE